MSRYEWERGTIKLPAAEYAKVRQAVQAADKAHKEAVFARTQAFWKALTRKEQTDTAAYMEALRRLERAERDTESTPAEEALYLMRSVVGWDGARKPARVLVSAMKYPTNRSTSFEASLCHVSFEAEARTVTWSVEDNNHARDHAAKTHLSQALFGALAKVRWTHGTGGVLIGNDEYNRDADYEGGGGNYVTRAFGYLGIAEAPLHTTEFTNAKGQRIKADIKMTRTGVTAKPAVAATPSRRYY